jgi:hypothetical protein
MDDMNTIPQPPQDPNLRAARQFWLLQLKMAEAQLELLDQIERQQLAAEGMLQTISEQAVQLELYRAQRVREFRETNKDLEISQLPETRPAITPRPVIVDPSGLIYPG